MSDQYTGADLFVDALERYGVSHLFGNPGTTELPVMNALADSDIEYVLGLHEDVAVGMAGGYASTRRYHADDDPSVLPLGVTNLHVAPGTAHGLGNLYNAAWGGVPLLVTAGNHATDYVHEEPILHGDMVTMTRQFTKWSDRVLDVAALPTMLRRAVKTALTPPTGPVFLELPRDVMLAETDGEPERLGPVPTGGPGDPDQLDRAADLLAAAEEPVLVVGDHVARAGRDAVAAAVDVAEATGARVHGEVITCEVNFPNDHPQWAGFLGGSAMETLEDADLLVMVGCSTGYAGGRYPVEAGLQYVHVSPDAWQAGKNQPADATVLGDPGAALASLAERLEGRVSAADREARLGRVERAQETLEAQVEDDRDPEDPRPSKSELVAALASVTTDVYLVDEALTSSYALLRDWPLAAEEYLSNKGVGLGYGLPAAVGAAIAEAEAGSGRRVVGYIGDGSSLYYPQALYSAVRAGVDLVVVVPDNRGYYILKRNMADMLGGEVGDHEYLGMDFEPAIDIPGFAEAQGAVGHVAEGKAEISAAFEDALDAGGVHVIDAPIHD